MNNPIISITLSLPELEAVRPKIIKPIDFELEEQILVKEQIEKLLIYPEIHQLGIDDLVNGNKELSEIYSTVYQKLDILYQIYVSYNSRYCVSIESMKQMSYHAFSIFCNDIDYITNGAYFFYLSTLIHKALNPKISGKSFEAQQDW